MLYFGINITLYVFSMLGDISYICVIAYILAIFCPISSLVCQFLIYLMRIVSRICTNIYIYGIFIDVHS